MYKDSDFPLLAILRRLTVTMVLAGTLPTANALATPRIASLDWTLAETLVALDAPPQALAQIDNYVAWVGKCVPAGVIDLGLRTQPNMELLASLQPDAIIISPLFANLTPWLSNIAPVRTHSLHTPGIRVWPELQNLTRQLGELSRHEAQAEQLIAASDAYLDELVPLVPEDTRPLMIMQFMDTRHVRVFGASSLFVAVMEHLGLTNAWQETTNAWGFTLVGIERLASLEEVRMVVVEPLPIGVSEALESNRLWQHLGSVKRGDVITLPPVWSFGGLPSATRFAETLVGALTAHERAEARSEEDRTDAGH